MMSLVFHAWQSFFFFFLQMPMKLYYSSQTFHIEIVYTGVYIQNTNAHEVIT